VVLLTAQIHQGIRLSPLKVLVSLVFRPASNLLLRLLHICNNATFALLHSKRHVRSEKLNKLRERCLNRAHLIGGASGRRQGRFRGRLKKGVESNYEPYPGIHREVAGAIFGAEQRCVPTERCPLQGATKIEKKNFKKGGNESYPQNDLAQSLVGDNQRLIKCSNIHRKFLIIAAHTSVIHPAMSLLSSSQTFKKRTIVQGLRHSRGKL